MAIDSPRTDPRARYQERLAHRRSVLKLEQGRDRLVSKLRLLVFLAAVTTAVFAYALDRLDPAWIAVPALGFALLVLLHDRVLRRRDLAQDATVFYQRALERIAQNWPGTGCQATDYVPAGHPYAADLDIFGEGSLFELLCTARTRAGEETLAAWLAQPAPVKTIQARQQAVDDLRERLDLREDLAVLGGSVRAEVRPQVLVRWATGPAVFPGRSATVLRVLAWLLGVATPVVLSASLLGAFDRGVPRSAGTLALLVLLALEGALYLRYRRRVREVTIGVERPERDLRVLAVMLGRLQAEVFQAPRLRELQAELQTEGKSAGPAISRLARLVMWLDSERNALFAPVGLITMWGLHFALAIERWRQHAGPQIPRWIDAVGEFEALIALASYAFEHPGDPFPELTGEGPLLDGELLGHPLLAEAVCVRNSVRLDPGSPVWIISGSNMSGKTTLMRTVGVNVVLAQAGAPVRADRLRLSPLCLGATIRIQDSLLDGRSRFYEEIKRLQDLMTLAEGERPLLFLLDELLHGTNSHDRQVGAKALLRQFVGLGAVGLVSTHDLALAEPSESTEGRVINKHFVDRVEEGELVFDYRLREGVVQRSNAIALMRAVGLKV